MTGRNSLMAMAALNPLIIDERVKRLFQWMGGAGRRGWRDDAGDVE
jgi:hypothetical protein